ncbi:MAG: hypothetical protein RLZZ480_326 [Candidatus Parcubacteria bacterium]
MKKVLFILGFLLVTGTASSVYAETIKIYPVSDGFNQLGDIDGQTNWISARLYDATLLGNLTNNDADHLTVRSDKGSGRYRIYRGSMSFDTSVLPDSASITSVSINVYKEPANNSGNTHLVFTSHIPAANTILEKTDWQLSNYGDEFSRGLLADNRYTTFNFNNTGLNHVNKAGYTVVGEMTEYDFDNVTPPLVPGAAFNASFYSIETSGTDKDPYLEIEYTVPGEVDEFPLYTQVISDHPSIAETTSWANDSYASGKGALGSYPCGLYIKNCGCALSSLVMSARNVGIDTSIVNDSVDPGNLNTYLDSVGGYDSEGGMYWLKAQAYFGRLNSEGKVESRFAALKQVSTNVMSTIDAALAAGDKAVLGYKHGHFVWVPAKEGAGYIVRDPYWYDTETADDVAVPNLVKDYNNTFESARIVSIANEPVLLSGIEAHLISETAEMLFKNTAGQKVGYENGSVLLDLANASYGNTEVISLDGAPVSGTNKNLLVYNADNQFTIDVVGTGVGSFSLEFLAITETGETKTFTLTGTTIPGVTTTFLFDLETGAVVEQPISYNQFLTILNKEMVGYTKQQKAFFLKWAEKIYSDMETKTVTQAVKSIETYQKLLVAKKIKNPVLFSVTDLLKSQVK